MRLIRQVKKFCQRNKKVYKELLINDFKTRYNGSFLGSIWGVIQPVVTIMIYWLVFQYGLKSGERPDGMPYVFYMVVGSIPWFFFSDAWGSITASFLDYSYLVKKLNFDIKLIPLVKLGSAFLIHIVFFFIGCLIVNIGGYYISWYYLQIIYFMFATAVFAFALGMITSALAVYIRDTIQMVGIILQIGFWANPICWGREILTDKLELLFKLNPMYYIVEGYRNCILYKHGFWEDPLYTVYFWTVMAVLLLLARYIFRKLRPYFADVM